MITCANVTEIPVSDLVIKAVEKMGYDQGFPTTGTKFTNRQVQIYLDNDWIAGVDYDEYEDEENHEDPEDKKILKMKMMIIMEKLIMKNDNKN